MTDIFIMSGTDSNIEWDDRKLPWKFVVKKILCSKIEVIKFKLTICFEGVGSLLNRNGGNYAIVSKSKITDSKSDFFIECYSGFDSVKTCKIAINKCIERG